MIGIIGAMSVEVEGLKSKLVGAVSEKLSGCEFVSGKLCGKDVVIAQCGIGKVNAAVCVNTMILKYGVSAVINTGVAGTLCEKIGILDFAISTGVVQHDMDTTVFGDAPGFISGIDIVTIPASDNLSALALSIANEQGNKCELGIVASGDQFINKPEKKAWLKEKIENAVCCEMEGASVAQASFEAGVPFAIIRVISDSADDNADFSFDKFVDASSLFSQGIIKEFFA